VGDTLRMEAERIRTLRAVWLLALLAVILGVAASAFLATTPHRGTLSAETTRSVITGGAARSLVPFAGLPLLFLGVAAGLEDTRHKVATVLFVAQPRRSTLMRARLLVLAAIAVPVGLVQMLLSSAVALMMGRAPQFAEGLPIAPPYLGSLVVFTCVGAALAWLTGNAAAAVGFVTGPDGPGLRRGAADRVLVGSARAGLLGVQSWADWKPSLIRVSMISMASSGFSIGVWDG
jgi:hypothetical protein